MRSKYLSTNQAALELGVTQPHIIKQINLGRLKAMMVGSQYIIDDGDLSEYRQNKRPVGRPKTKNVGVKVDA